LAQTHAHTQAHTHTHTLARTLSLSQSEGPGCMASGACVGSDSMAGAMVRRAGWKGCRGGRQEGLLLSSQLAAAVARVEGSRVRCAALLRSQGLFGGGTHLQAHSRRGRTRLAGRSTYWGELASNMVMRACICKECDHATLVGRLGVVVPVEIRRYLVLGRSKSRVEPHVRTRTLARGALVCMEAGITAKASHTRPWADATLKGI
jgi:hypothetical protein